MWRASCLIVAVAAALAVPASTAAAAGTAPAGGGAAASRAAAGTRRSLPPIKVVNWHRAYERALARDKGRKPGTIAGIVYARGKAPKAAFGPHASCTEPHCQVSWHGGPVQHSITRLVVFWGPNWQTDPNQQRTEQFVHYFFDSLGNGAPGFLPDSWSPIMSEYTDNNGPAGTMWISLPFQDTSTPPTGASQTQLAAEAEAAVNENGLNGTPNLQVVIATQSGTCPAGFDAPAVCGNNGGTQCGWHSVTSYQRIPFINLPYEIDAGAACGAYTLQNQYDGFSLVGGREFANTATDPVPGTAWDDLGAGGLGEIGDKCSTSDAAVVRMEFGAYTMLPLFSNVDYSHTGNGCITGVPDDVNVYNPGAQTSSIGTNVDIGIPAYPTTCCPVVTYSAWSLPPGLSIDPTTGLITGDPPRSALTGPPSLSPTPPAGSGGPLSPGPSTGSAD
jgi:serine protease